MRQPRRRKSSRAQISVTKSYPSPVGGWNERDALAAMRPTDAIHLDNWFPRPSYCEIRGGYASHATGMASNGKTLAVYNALNGTNKMFCATSSGVYDVSSPGAVGASVAARTNGKHQWINMGDGTNNYLMMFNGVDKPLYFDGTSWVAVDAASSPALTGLTTTKIISVYLHKGRAYFIEKDSLSFWYLAAGAVGGALTEFDLSAVCKEGGFLMAMASWTIDGGDGPDDRAVFITSEGEAIVYIGTNPSSGTTWSLQGVYNFGRPLGRRCLTKYSGDLLVITENGVFQMAAAAQSAAIDYKLALSNKIEKAFTSAALNYGSNFGWTAIFYPAESALIVNIPYAEDGIHYQYVMNTITKSWCRFLAWDAEDFAVFNKELYYTTGTAVVKAWSGFVDGEDNIEAYGKTAFSYFGNQVQSKKFHMFRPIFSVNGSISFLTDIDIDFQDNELAGSVSYTQIAGSLWDIANWDEDYWTSGLQVTKDWTSPAQWTGFSAAGKVKVVTNLLKVQWMSCDYLFEHAGVL